MASAWIIRRKCDPDGKNAGKVRYRVLYRVGGHETSPRYAGSFSTKTEALERKKWVAGELAAMRVPDLSASAEPVAAPTLREKAEEWQRSRKDVRGSTTIQHRTALGACSRSSAAARSTRSPPTTCKT